MFGKNGTAGPARTVSVQKGTGPAINLSKLRAAGHVELVKRADHAGVALDDRGLTGIRAGVVLVLTHSRSMHPDYASGKVQQFVERVLGFALQVDDDGTVPVLPFDSQAWPVVNATVNNYRDIVNREIWKAERMATTDLAAALNVVRAMAKVIDTPLYCAVVTDGNPDTGSAATEVVCDLARYPVFLKFLAIRPVPYLQELDKLPDSNRLLDNVDTKPDRKNPGLDLLTCSDSTFAVALADGWDGWFVRAKKAGVLK